VLRKRVEILFEPTEYERLAAEAKRRHRSVGWMVREAVRDQYLAPTREEKLRALDELLKLRIDLGTWEEAKELIEESYTDRIPDEE